MHPRSYSLSLVKKTTNINHCHLCPVLRSLTNLPAKPDFHLRSDHLTKQNDSLTSLTMRPKFEKKKISSQQKQLLPCWRARQASDRGLAPSGRLSEEADLLIINHDDNYQLTIIMMLLVTMTIMVQWWEACLGEPLQPTRRWPMTRKSLCPANITSTFLYNNEH